MKTYTKKIETMSKAKVKNKRFPLLSFTDATGTKWKAKFKEKKKRWKTGKNTTREQIIIDSVVYLRVRDED